MRVDFNNEFFKDSFTFDFFAPATMLFEGSGTETPIDTKTYPYLHNKKGHTEHVAEPPEGTLTKEKQEDLLKDGMNLRLGHRYSVLSNGSKTIDGSYEITELEFGASQVLYKPLWADEKTDGKNNCQAFGIILVRNNESIEFRHRDLVRCHYIYSRFSAYQSPYIGRDRRRELLTWNPTDLEYHDFPHVFSSQDNIPLVISVARYLPKRGEMKQGEIWLADLWVRPGDCLYLPPKHYNEDDDYFDLHGNRNSAHACWGADKDTLLTETTLGNAQVFSAPATRPHYHEEKTPTVHSFPPGFPAWA